MSTPDSSLPGSPGSASQMSDAPPESGQRQRYSSVLLSNDEDIDDLLHYEDVQQEFGDEMVLPNPDENWGESSVYGAEDEGDLLSGDESDFKRTPADGDYMLPVIERENKYHGPATTWRYWTRYERQESSAIETSRARDLAAHLFNAYALKKRADGMRIREGEDEPDDLRAKAAAASDSSFKAPSRWVAWPIPPSEVPRTDTEIYKDKWTMRMELDSRPSDELEGCLLAEMMKGAKERFEERQWKTSRAKVYRRTKEETPKEIDLDNVTGHAEDRESDVDMDAEVEYRPVVSADDEASKRILLPAARHTLSQLDSLLLSLHYAREAYATRHEPSGASTPADTDAESVVATETSLKKRRMRSASRSQSRGRKRTRSSLPPEKAPVRDSESGSEYVGSDRTQSRSSPGSEDKIQEQRAGRRRTTSGTDRKGRLGLRDWSDIIGIATMSGWSQSVVTRTAQRCAHLFGEDMLFRTLDDEEMSKRTNATQGSSLGAESSEESGTKSKLTSRRGKAGVAVQATGSGQMPSRGKVFCPVEGCGRQNIGFSRTWNLNLHMRRIHSRAVVAGTAVPESDKGEDEPK